MEVCEKNTGAKWRISQWPNGWQSEQQNMTLIVYNTKNKISMRTYWYENNSINK